MTYNHMLDIAFTVESSHANWEDVPIEEIAEALLKHTKYLYNHLSELKECVGFCDTIELDEEEN